MRKGLEGGGAGDPQGGPVARHTGPISVRLRLPEMVRKKALAPKQKDDTDDDETIHHSYSNAPEKRDA